jgi:glycosyltransferase involved in cell wall biosynthesis
MTKPLVSVVIPNFNKAPFVEETLQCLVGQTHDRWEALIVDDNSTDGSWDIITECAEKDDRFRPLKNGTGRRNGSVCRNLGIASARGDVILFLDSDDLLAPSCLQNRLVHLERMNADFVVSPMGTFLKQIGDRERVWWPRKSKALQRFLAHDLPWAVMCPAYRIDFIRRMVGFDEEFPRLQDVEFHTRCLFETECRFAVIECEPDCFYRVDECRSTVSDEQQLRVFAEGVVKFLGKFHLPAASRGRRYRSSLLGTLYRGIEGVARARANGLVSTGCSQELIENILNTPTFRESNWFNRRLISTYLSWFHSDSARQPAGVSLLMRTLLTS